MRQDVLFVCTHNAARSQMAEGLLRALYGERFRAFSAGTEPGSVHPLAIRAMAEMGIDLLGHRSKSLDEFRGRAFAYVITVCDQARDRCPVFPNAGRVRHWGLPDPSRAEGDDAARLEAFRRVRDALAQRLAAEFLETG